MATRTFKEHNGTVLSTVAQTLLTFSTGLITGGAVLQGVTLTNTGGAARVVTVYKIPSGQTAANQYIIFKDTVPANSSSPIPGGPWYGGSGSFIQALQDAGTDVIAAATAFEES